jgi:hypothetical protein
LFDGIGDLKDKILRTPLAPTLSEAMADEATDVVVTDYQSSLTPAKLPPFGGDCRGIILLCPCLIETKAFSETYDESTPRNS